MEIPFYQVDAFASEAFRGNPAGVCLLDSRLEDGVLQSIAAENNLSETAFVVRNDTGFGLRWFTPEMEVDLCGHATLAAGHVLFHHVEPTEERLTFSSKSGELAVERRDDLLYLDFPTRAPAACARPEGLDRALGVRATEVLCSRDLLAVFDDESVIRNISPDFPALSHVDCFAVIVTAPAAGEGAGEGVRGGARVREGGGEDCDFVSRFFAPGAGVPEDPVTGSAHCTLVPYWAERLGRTELHARQLSARGGELFCAHRGERVSIGGRCVEYLAGTISL